MSLVSNLKAFKLYPLPNRQPGYLYQPHRTQSLLIEKNAEVRHGTPYRCGTIPCEIVILEYHSAATEFLETVRNPGEHKKRHLIKRGFCSDQTAKRLPIRCLSTKLTRMRTKSTPPNSLTNRTGDPGWKQFRPFLPTH